MSNQDEHIEQPSKPIPERYREDYEDCDRTCFVCHMIEEVGAAEARVRELEQEREEAKAEVAACMTFLSTELHWEWFRIEMLYSGPNEEEKKRCSEDNARMLSNYLKEAGHGIKLLGELSQLQAQLAAVTQERDMQQEQLDGRMRVFQEDAAEIRQLQARNKEMHALIESNWTKQAGGHACGCDEWPECTHTLAAAEMRSEAMKIDAALTEKEPK
jgi:hypothetical protein